MKAVALVDLDLTYVAVGLAALYGLGFVRSWRSGLRYLGLALTSGWALVGILSSFALMLGSGLDLATLLALAIALVAAGVVAGRRVAAAPSAPGWRATPLRLVAAFAGGGVVVAVLVETLRRARLLAGPWEWDAWAFWIPKAEAIVYRGGIGVGPGSFSSFANPDYPPLVPAADATVFRFADSVDPSLLGIQHWLLAVAFLSGIGALLWRRVPPEVLFPALAVLVLLPAFDASVASLLAEDSLLIALGTAGVAAALWLLERDWRDAAIFVVFAGALALTKNEGFFDALLLGVLVAAPALRRHRGVAACAVAAPLVAMLPWKLWLHLNDVPANPYYTASDFLRTSRTVDQSTRLWTTLADLPGYYLRFDRSLVLLPLLAVLVVLVRHRRPLLALFPVVALGTMFLGNVAVYWVSNVPLRWYIETSADRTSAGPIVLAAVLAPLVAAEVVDTRGGASFAAMRERARRLFARRGASRRVPTVAAADPG